MIPIIQIANNPMNFSSIAYPIQIDIEFYRMLHKPIMNQQIFTIMNYSIFKKYI